MKKQHDQRHPLTVMTDREWNHRLVEAVDEKYQAALKWVLQQYAARSLNEKYEREKEVCN